MSSELKACKTCGLPAEVNRHHWWEFKPGEAARCSEELGTCPDSWRWVRLTDWNRRSPSPAVLALVEACREIERDEDFVRGMDPHRIGRVHRLMKALAAVEREIGDQFADASKKVEGGSDAHR